MNIISPRTCRICKNEVIFQEVRQCSFCGTKGKEPPYYCIRRCRKASCRTLNCPDHLTCWKAHLPSDEDAHLDHQKVNQLPQIYVTAVTYSEPDAAKQKTLHDDDRIAQWFVVKLESNPQELPSLHVSDRFRRLCNPGISGSRWSSNVYPSFVSFIGDTGTGKSTLVRATILMGQVIASRLRGTDEESSDEKSVGELGALISGKIHGPVTRTANHNHLTDPTSTGVHLYKDITARGSDRATRFPSNKSNTTPILFADCEGFGSGTAMNNADRNQSDSSNMEGMNPYLLFQRPITSENYAGHGKAGAELFYARFLYAFSDVVVFVTKEDQRFQEDMQRLLEWAASAVNKSINHLAQKTLVIVRNMANRHVPEFYEEEYLKTSIFENLGPLWKGSEQLTAFRNNYNRSHELVQRHIHSNSDFFAIFFQKVNVCYIPDKDKAPMDEIFAQYQTLRKQIVRASEAGQEIRAKCWTQYNIPTLSHLLLRAFEHFRTSEKPFDFYQAARKDNPNPVSVSDHIANFLRHMQLSQGMVSHMFSKVVSMCLVTCALRNFEQAWEPKDIFSKLLERLCKDGIQKYCEKFQNCAFRFQGGSKCITRRIGHIQHCDVNGARIPGAFDASEYQEDPTKSTNEIRKLFINDYKSLCAQDQKAPSLPDPTVLLKLREDVFQEFTTIWRLTTSNKTCFTCLQSAPDHVLPCGHGYCGECVKEFGKKSKYLECGIVMDHCILCQTQWREQHSQLIRLKPRCAGVRILTLDGGGVRGIMELALLEKLEHRVGLKLPIKDLFDLIMGTSTGGIISLGLAITNYTTAELRAKFADLAAVIFKGVLPVLDPLQIISKAMMLLRISESVYPTGPLREGLKQLFGEDLNLYSSPRAQKQQRSTRVAVTSTKDTAANRCLVTNYNRPDFSSGDDFEREDEDGNEMKVWEAALATAAAPFYFKPFKKAETMKDYVDGALHANLPIQYALEEMANLWTGECQPKLDALVSVGTGIQQKELEIPTFLKIGGFQQICTNFQSKLNTDRLWKELMVNFAYPTEIRSRIHRLNAEIQGDYVALYDYKKMRDMEAMVEQQTMEIDKKPSPLASKIARVADILTASLFFFEPDPPSFADANLGSSPTSARIHELKGSIRCRLMRSSLELKHLLNIVDSFWQKEVSKRSLSVSSPNFEEKSGWKRIPLSDKEKARIRTEDAWFRVDCTISTQDPSEMLQIIAVSLCPPSEEEKYYCHERFPISGFPVNFNELQRKANMT